MMLSGKWCKSFLIFVPLLLCGGAWAKNLLTNGDFREGLLHWKFESRSAVSVTPFAEGGPENLPFIRMKGISGRGAFTRVFLSLPKGEKFRITCRYRLHKSANPYKVKLTILCLPKKHEFPLTGECGKWLTFDKIFTAAGGANYLSFSLNDAPGMVDIAGASVEPLSEKSRSGTAMDNTSAVLVPLANMHLIPADDCKVKFQWSGKFPADEKMLKVRFSDAGNPERSIILPLKERLACPDLKLLGREEGNLTAVLFHAENGEEFFRGEYKYKIIDFPKLAGAKKLNNLVTELYNAPVKSAVSLAHPRQGWIFVRFIPGKSGEKYSVSLDGKEILTEKTFRNETVRACSPGKLRFTHSGGSGRLIVRMIPDILSCPLGLNDWPGSGPYNWNFAKKYMLPAVTTFDAGIPGKRAIAEMKSMGMMWFSNNPTNLKEKKEEILERVRKRLADAGKHCDGISFDEMTLSQPGNNDKFAWVLRNFDNPDDLILHTWITGTAIPANGNLFSAAINASQGRGRLLHEIYKHVLRTEQEAEYSLEMSRQQTRVVRQILGRDFQHNYSIILGCFNDYPSISLAVCPEADMKYFMEMLIRNIAFDRNYEGLGGIGFWGLHHANEELVRWSFALMRHYAIEGRSDRLSDKYGFTYNPGHLKNPDFESSLDHWQANELVRAEKLENFGKGIQHRWGAAEGVGDQAAVLSRTEDKYGVLTQTMSGFIPGKVYSLVYLTADYHDVKNRHFNPKRQPVVHQLDKVTILRNLRIVPGRKPASEKARQVRINACKVIFRAESPEIKLTFNNEKARAGEETIINYICVTPYFEK